MLHRTANNRKKTFRPHGCGQFSAEQNTGGTNLIFHCVQKKEKKLFSAKPSAA